MSELPDCAGDRTVAFAHGPELPNCDGGTNVAFANCAGGTTDAGTEFQKRRQCQLATSGTAGQGWARAATGGAGDLHL